MGPTAAAPPSRDRVSATARRQGRLGPRRGCHDPNVESASMPSHPNAVLLWGEDPFLLREAAAEALEGVRPVEVEAAAWQGGETSDLSTPSLFGEVRALLVTGCRHLPEAGIAELATYLASPAPDARLVLLSQVAERGKPAAALVKLVKPVGEVRQIAVARKDLPQWVLSRAGRHSLALAPDAGRALIEVVGESPAALDAAVEQLATAFGTRRVTREQVESQFTGLGEQRVWDLSDRLFERDAARAVRSLRSLLESREEPLAILGGVSSRVRDLIRVKSLPERTPPAELARAAGLRFDWQARRYREQARRFTLAELVAVHARIAQADRELKSGSPGDVVLPVVVTEITTPA
jgi:DNA polymerase-3 subunit delta